jgi:T-lymphocyte triggering factor
MASNAKKVSKEKTKVSGSLTVTDDREHMDKESLQKLIEQLEQGLDQEIKARNAAQVEYDAVLSYFSVTEKRILDADMQVRMMSRHIEDREEEQGIEIQVYGNKVKHLLYNHNVKLQEESISKDKLLQEANLIHQMNLLNIDRETDCAREEWQDRQLLHINEIDILREKYQEDVRALQMFFESELDRCKKQSLQFCDELHEEYYIKNAVDKRVYEEKLNQFIFELERLHHLEIQDIHIHYETIFENNARVISDLEMKIHDLNTQLFDNSRLIDQLNQENETLIIPLELVNRTVR